MTGQHSPRLSLLACSVLSLPLDHPSLLQLSRPPDRPSLLQPQLSLPPDRPSLLQQSAPAQPTPGTLIGPASSSPSLAYPGSAQPAPAPSRPTSADLPSLFWSPSSV